MPSAHIDEVNEAMDVDKSVVSSVQGGWKFRLSSEKARTLSFDWTEDDLNKLARGWFEKGSWEVFGFMVAYKGLDKASTLAQQVMRAFKPGGFPTMSQPFGGWVSFTRKEKLLDALVGGFRFSGIDFLSYADPGYFWPPPLVEDHKDSSDLWALNIKEGCTTEELIGLLAAAGITKDFGIFRAYSVKDKAVYNSALIRALNVPVDKKTTFTVNAGQMTATLNWLPRCSLCMRGQPEEPSHLHKDCPFVATINKVRAKAGFKPARLVDGIWNFEEVKLALDVEKELKGIREKVDKLDVRVKTLEGKSTDTPSGKKRKASDPVSESPKKKKAKKTEGKGAKGGSPQKSKGDSPKEKKGKGKKASS